jgi:tRNA threonylcarbamoyladenosine biosynthesis protein TsaE
MKMLSTSLEMTAQIAQDVVKKVQEGTAAKKATIVALSGDLGSGKTAFVQAVARALGVQETVTSPTFIIEKIYQLKLAEKKDAKKTAANFSHLIHIDAYRLESGRELKHLGWNEIVADPGNLIFVEWPEKIADIIPKEVLTISFTFIDEKTREISSSDF